MSQGLLLAGDVFIDRFNSTGEATGLVGPINVTQLSVNTPTEEKTRTSRKKATRGQALDNVTTAQPTEVQITIDDAPAEVLAMALLGEVEGINNGSGSATDEAITLPGNGRWVQLSKSNLAETGLSAKLAIDDSAIANDAIEVNYAAGLVRAVIGSVVDAPAGTAIKLSYDYNALSGMRVKGGLKPQITAKILLEGTNLTTGKAVKLTIPKATLAPTAAVDFMADEFVSTQLAGKAVLAAGETSPFQYDELA
ncbi:phage tail tube protein [Agarivorans gilvus]|uniref:Major tail protein n=1 Tax=Agarivorans gilvus TaxID=680279 RepID=A0ABQ1HYR5_9ALTE|nr:hypothetical protein [Agarivorans gilvus]GGA95764.1 hypothetical protein GCM10007414_05740 [Agarivorans gilvus]